VAEHDAGDSDARPSEAEIYARRFPDAETRARMDMWREIAAYLQRYIPREATVLDMGAGAGEFISNIDAAQKWATDIRDVSDVMPPDVHFVQADGLSLAASLEASQFDRIFMSNYLEHLPSGDAVVEQLRVVAGLLKPDGRVVILQPNIALTGASYWDFIDHKVALTEHSLAEAVELAGMTPLTTIRRFLPYSTKGRMPTSANLVRWYLRFPLAWRFMGKQTLMVAGLVQDRP
jgi:SAM-dependent methyltransferase